MGMKIKISCISILISFILISQNNTIYYNDLNIDTLINTYKLLKTDNELTIYRIQLVSNESPEKIEKIKKKYLEIYPEEDVEEVFEPPYFKAITGIYLNKKDAEKKRHTIKRKFKSSFIFKETINITKFMEKK